MISTPYADPTDAARADPDLESKATRAQLQCVRVALRGLRFPCLAEQEIGVSHAALVRGYSVGDFF